LGKFNLSPEYANSKESRAKLAAAVQVPASWLMEKLYQKRLAEPTPRGKNPEAFIMAGGAGSGKTTAIDEIAPLKRQKDSAQLIADTTLSSKSGAIEMIDLAIQAGKKVKIVYVNRDPIKAFEGGVLPRMSTDGRSVPIDAVAKSHAGAAATILDLERRYADNPNVSIHFVDNNGAKGSAAIVEKSKIHPQSEEVIKSQMNASLDRAYKQGVISRSVYDQMKSP
jgi:predicted ABC-type ATPase